MVDITKPLRVKQGLAVRNVRILTSDCKCSLSAYQLVGEIYLDDIWRTTKWTTDGKNISGLDAWTLENC